MWDSQAQLSHIPIIITTTMFILWRNLLNLHRRHKSLITRPYMCRTKRNQRDSRASPASPPPEYRVDTTQSPMTRNLSWRMCPVPFDRFCRAGPSPSAYWFSRNVPRKRRCDRRLKSLKYRWVDSHLIVHVSWDFPALIAAMVIWIWCPSTSADDFMTTGHSLVPPRLTQKYLN